MYLVENECGTFADVGATGSDHGDEIVGKIASNVRGDEVAEAVHGNSRLELVVGGEILVGFVGI